jgi:hypothetical protein
MLQYCKRPLPYVGYWRVATASLEGVHRERVVGCVGAGDGDGAEGVVEVLAHWASGP